MRGAYQATLLLGLLLLTGLGLVLWFEGHKNSDPVVYGATFSPTYARFLGLDEHETLVAIMTELPIKEIRIPVQWDEVQPNIDTAYFDELDVIMNTAATHNVGIVLAIGNKVPRWPECYTPDWAKDLSRPAYEAALLDYVDLIVMRYREHPALVRWQVENETLFVFGDCPAQDFKLVKQEIEVVRALDAVHPIQLTVSGEQQLWVSVAGQADVIGTSMYRRVALPNGWPITFPIPPGWYALQALSVRPFVDQVVISELQAEPWLSKDYREYSFDQAADLFPPARLETYLRYARRSGIKNISLWGVEWWYYLKQNGHPELWNTGRDFLSD